MKHILVIATNLVEDVELVEPVEALKKAGHRVTLVSPDEGFLGKHGTKFMRDATIESISIFEFDALFIPGGFSPDQLRTDDRFVSVVREFMLMSKSVFAICHGPQIFIQAGVVKGRILTATEPVIPDLYFAGAITKDEEVVKDNNLITSREPKDIPAFNEAILSELEG